MATLSKKSPAVHAKVHDLSHYSYCDALDLKCYVLRNSPTLRVLHHLCVFLHIVFCGQCAGVATLHHVGTTKDEAMMV